MQRPRYDPRAGACLSQTLSITLIWPPRNHEAPLKKNPGYGPIIFSKHFKFPSLLDGILSRNALIRDTFQIASRNLVLFSSHSRGSYLESYVVIFSKYFKLPFLFDAILRRNATIWDTYQIAFGYLVFFQVILEGHI